MVQYVLSKVSHYSPPKPVCKCHKLKEEKIEQLKVNCVMDYFTWAFYYAKEV